MATFIYNRKLELEPRPGTKYATVYIKQTHAEHERLRQWLIEIGTQILGVCEMDPQMAEWFSTPLMDFRKSQRGQYYTAQDLLTDMIEQLTLGRDMPESMLNRWNRLCQSTPWEIEMIPGNEHTHLAIQPLV